MVVNVEKEQVKGFGASLSDCKRKRAGNITFSPLFSGGLNSCSVKGFPLTACFCLFVQYAKGLCRAFVL